MSIDLEDLFEFNEKLIPKREKRNLLLNGSLATVTASSAASQAAAAASAGENGGVFYWNTPDFEHPTGGMTNFYDF